MKRVFLSAWVRGSTLLAGLLLCAASTLHAGGAAGQELDNQELAPGAEGRLSNDAFLPTSKDAQESLEAGDAALVEARKLQIERPADADRRYIECFDAWHNALWSAAPRAFVWAQLQGAESRSLSEGLHYALQRRVSLLSDAERERWTQRSETLASPALGAAGRDKTALMLVARRYPVTQSAAHAELKLADIALERGASSEAGTWLRRAQADLPKGPLLDSMTRAIERRIKRLPQAVASPAWDETKGFELISSVPIGLNMRQPATGITPRSARMRGPRPGLVFVSKTRLAVQAAQEIHLFRLAPNGLLTAELSFACSSLSFPNGTGLPFEVPLFDPRRARRAPGWQFAPACAGNNLYVVSGQAVPEGLPNALLSLTLPAPLLPGTLTLTGQAPQPKLNWAILGNERVDSGGLAHQIDQLKDLVELEFQPGPIVLEDHIVVQARSYGDLVHSWLMCFDRHTGKLQWRFILGSGADLLEDQGRLGMGGAARLSAPPMTRVPGPRGLGERLFVSTNLGFCVLVDLLDGRPLWAFKNRRRKVDDLGWDGYQAMLGSSGKQPAIWWAPFDSDRLYALCPNPLRGTNLGRSSLLAERPRALGESRTLLGADALGVVTQGRAGHEQTISNLSLHPERGIRRVDALYLGPGEEFLGRGMISPSRVVTCSERGLYLFDRERELYLLDYVALPRSLGPHNLAPGGDLYALDGLIFALGKNGIWSFRPN